MRAVFTNQQVIERYLPLIDEGTAAFLDRAVAAVVACKRVGGKVVVPTSTKG